MNFNIISSSLLEFRLETYLIISLTFLLSFVIKLLLCRYLFTKPLRLKNKKRAHGLVVAQNSKLPKNVTPLNNVKHFSCEAN